MTPEQLEEFKKLTKETADAQIAMFRAILDGLAVAKEQMQITRKPIDEFNTKTKSLSSFLGTLNRAAELEGRAAGGGSAGAARRTLHKKNVGIIRN